MSGAYYNEFDPYAAQWLRNLIAKGLIASGDVDERSIEDVFPDDVKGYTQCHFFAGIGVWSYALRNSGWGDDRPVWTGSCPCQPFSAAGKGVAFDDERHLWPAFNHLIGECRPPIIFGEQVASKDADAWIDLVQDDLEGMGYAVGAIPFPAAGVGAPHIRDRMYWVAYASGERQYGWGTGEAGDGRNSARVEPKRLCDAVRVEHARHYNDAGEVKASSDRKTKADRPADFAGGPGVSSGGLADPERERVCVCKQGGTGGSAQTMQRVGKERQRVWANVSAVSDSERSTADSTNGHWRDADWLFCRDGRWRPVEPGTSPLAHGSPARVGRLRAYGNAIVAQAAQAFIESVMECMP